MAYRFEPLGPEHHREDFACGEPALDAYLRERARKDVMRAVAAVYVMVDEGVPAKVMGYYSLSSFAIAFSDLPESILRKLPKYPLLPATLLGRLARDRRYPGTGALLLRDALGRSYRQTAAFGSIAVVAEAKNEAAAVFYHKFGFARLGGSGGRLFSPDGYNWAIAPDARLIGLAQFKPAAARQPEFLMIPRVCGRSFMALLEGTVGSHPAIFRFD